MTIGPRTLQIARRAGIGAAPAAAIIAAAAGIAAQPLDADLWVHLNTGRHLAQTGGLPYPDPFSFSAGETIWTAHEWVAQWVIYQLVSSTGVGATTLVFGVLIGLVWLIVERTLAAHGVGPWPRALAVGAGALAVVPFGGIRPLQFGLLCAAAVLALLLWHRRTGTRAVWLVPLVFVAWANLHASFPVGLLSIGAIGADWAWRRLRLPGPGSARRTDIRVIVAVGALSVGALLVNPAGARLIAQPFWQWGLEVRRFNSDWQPPEAGSLTWWLFVVFLVFLGGAIAWGRGRISPALLVTMAVLLWAGFGSRKLMVFAAVLAPMLLAEPLGNWPNVRVKAPAWVERSVAAGVVGVALGLAVVFAPRTLAGPTVTPMPAEARAFLSGSGATRVFNTYHWGAYLTWDLWPQTRTYADGRFDLFANGPLPAYLDVTSLGPGWEATLARIDPDAVLVQSSAPLVGALANHGWRVVFRNDVATVLAPTFVGE